MNAAKAQKLRWQGHVSTSPHMAKQENLRQIAERTVAAMAPFRKFDPETGRETGEVWTREEEIASWEQ